MNPDTVKIGLDPTNPRRQNVDFFLKSSKREPMSLYQISSDNPQKDNFYKAFYFLTCSTYIDICFIKNNPPDPN